MSIMNLKKNNHKSGAFGTISQYNAIEGTLSERRQARRASNLDFFLESAVPSVYWMQECLRGEQR